MRRVSFFYRGMIWYIFHIRQICLILFARGMRNVLSVCVEKQTLSTIGKEEHIWNRAAVHVVCDVGLPSFGWHWMGSAPLRDVVVLWQFSSLCVNICGIKRYCKAARGFTNSMWFVGSGKHYICIRTWNKNDRGAVWQQIQHRTTEKGDGTSAELNGASSGEIARERGSTSHPAR